jgi:polysaccharide pyruvyl transferase WcaK-like protein
MWDLNEQFCSEIPTKKAENVVATLTDYNQDYEKDSLFLNLLEKNYKVVYIWPQGIGDVAYINSLNVSKKIVILSPNLESFNSLLSSSESIDYVGTRLHAGIRAMQFKRRSIIIGIDNRAIEKSKDFNLKICLRNELNDLNKLINSDFLSKINLPLKNIETWKNQFK